MPYYRTIGEIPRKRHSRFPAPTGGLYCEELIGEEGFSGDSSLVYHRYPPTAIIEATPLEALDAGLSANSPLLPRHLRSHELEASGDLVLGRSVLLQNDDVAVAVVEASEPSPLYRDALGDELVFIESGHASLESVFGLLEADAGDYVVVPASTTHRWVPKGPVRALVIEARSHVGPPKRYLSDRGQFLEQAPYSERDLRPPERLLEGDGEADVLVRHRSGLTRYRYLHHPFDVVGWDGCCYPFAFAIGDFEPVVKRFHAPPPVHQTFEGRGFVVCSFCPRPFDFDPSAVPVPYNHANTDCDEVIFYVGGDFMSRKGAGIGPGSLTVHPAGFIHGPQPGSVEAALGKPATDELAVMVDTFRPLALGRAALAIEDPDYAWSWARRRAGWASRRGPGPDRYPRRRAGGGSVRVR